MKILYVTTVAITMNFFTNFIERLVKEGNTVEIVSNCDDYELNEIYNELGCKVHNIPFSRSPINAGNIKAYKMLKKIVNDGNYDIVHCHTPIAAAATRLACRKVRKKGTKVFYTAHGFHFYKGAPLKMKLMFYPVQKFCAKYTDTLITINQEDFELAKRKFNVKKVAYVAGVGIDTAKFREADVNKVELCSEFGIPTDAKILLSVGELNSNKNHSTVIKALSQIDCSNLHYVIAGDGPLKEQLAKIALENGVEDRVHLLGQRTDVEKIYKLADLYIHPSFREGLPVAVMEAMASGLPCIVSNIRGSRDLIIDGKGGIVVKNNNSEEYKNAIESLISKENTDFSDFNMQRAKNFEFKEINREILNLYNA